MHLQDITLSSHTPDAVLSHPGMISNEERTLLYTLAAKHYTATGCIIDAGIFLGASTMALAYGLMQRDNTPPCPDTPKPIHSFERATVTPSYAPHAQRASLPPLSLGESYATLLHQLTAPVQDYTALHIGDIQDFDAGHLPPIEICFLDLFKDPALTLHCMRTFFPLMRVGGYVVQQDFFFDGLPFINVAMEAVSSHFKYLGEVQSSALFQLTTPILVEDIPEHMEDLPHARQLQLHRQSELRTKVPWRQYLMQLSRARLLVDLGSFASAHRHFQHVTDTSSTTMKDPPGRYPPKVARRVAAFMTYLQKKRKLSRLQAHESARSLITSSGRYGTPHLFSQVQRFCEQGRSQAAKHFFLTKIGHLLYSNLSADAKLHHLRHLPRPIQSGGALSRRIPLCTEESAGYCLLRSTTTGSLRGISRAGLWPLRRCGTCHVALSQRLPPLHRL